MYSLNDLPKKLPLTSPLVAALGSPAYAEPTAQPAIQNNQVQQNTTFPAISDNVDAIVNLLSSANPNDQLIVNNNLRQLMEGRNTFRFDAFGDTAFWGDTFKLHKAIAGEKLGGVGPGVSPRTVLAVGLKADVDALSPDLVDALKNGQVDLDDPASTQALLNANAVIGVKGVFDDKGRMTSLGITCALCRTR